MHGITYFTRSTEQFHPSMAAAAARTREAALLVAAAALLVLGGAEALSLDLYEERCPDAEAAVTAAVRQAMSKDRTVAAGLLRMHFHDCFVRVCMPSLRFDLHGYFSFLSACLP